MDSGSNFNFFSFKSVSLQSDAADRFVISASAVIMAGS